MDRLDKLRDKANPLATEFAELLQEAEAILPKLLKISIRSKDPLIIKSLKDAIEAQEKAHCEFWKACRIAGLTEGK